MRDALGLEEMDPDTSYIMIAGRFVWRVSEDGIVGQAMRLFQGPGIQDPERVQALVVGRLAWTIFALVPVFAALLRLLYRRRERFFVPHLVFALRFHTLGFLLMTVGIGVDTMLGTRPNVSSLAFLVAAVMLFSVTPARLRGRAAQNHRQADRPADRVRVGGPHRDARARDHHQSGGLAGPTGIQRPPPQNSAAVERLSEWC